MQKYTRRLNYSLLILTASLILTPLGFAQTERTVLLRNVTLIDREGGGDKSVNILIKDSILDIITEDLIPLEDAQVTYDAANGVVLGQLELGQPAGFLILAGDPRKNVEILLDTKTYATFAIAKGRILKNTFETVTIESPEEKKRLEEGWLAYAPPPLAVPLDYQDTSKWNRFDGDTISGIAVAALMLDRQSWLDQDSNGRDQVGDLDEFEGGEIRGLRFGGVGTINTFDRPVIWTFFAATSAFDKGFDSREDDDLTLYDLRLDFPLGSKTNFSIGKQKEPISMERIMSLAYLPQQERAAVSDALLPSRNVGMVLSGSMLKDRISWAGGAFNNWLDRDQPNSFSDNTTQYVVRATAVPFVSDNESTLLHLAGSYRYADAEEAVRIAIEPEFKQAPKFIDTGLFLGEDFTTYQGELSLRSGPFWLHSEYLKAESDAPISGDRSYDGYHVTASWITTGEVRPYNKRVGVFGRIPIARTVNQNGWGAWELSSRYSNLDLRDGPTDEGKLDIWSAGVNWWLSPYMNVNLNYRYITLDKLGVEGTSQGLSARVTLMLE